MNSDKARQIVVDFLETEYFCDVEVGEDASFVSMGFDLSDKQEMIEPMIDLIYSETGSWIKLKPKDFSTVDSLAETICSLLR